VSIKKPEDFWELRVHSVETPVGITGLCVGYEQKEWRYQAFANYIMDWLPEFCLNYKELRNLSAANLVRKLRNAASMVYQSTEYKKRGEFGEILLHAAVRSVFDSVPAISKIYFKDSANDTVKGFDCVHAVGGIDNLELWIGEVKFYTNVSDAISQVKTEILDHLDKEYLRKEFIAIGNKLDTDDERAQEVQKLISENQSLDNIFKRICVPILLTYESNVVQNNDCICRGYIDAFQEEIRNIHKRFTDNGKQLPEVRYHLFLLPLDNKDTLNRMLDQRLKAMQSI